MSFSVEPLDLTIISSIYLFSILIYQLSNPTRENLNLFVNYMIVKYVCEEMWHVTIFFGFELFGAHFYQSTLTKL